MAQVVLKNVKKSFGNVVAVENTNVTFKEGSFTTLLGPSGCGKTTILRMVAGLATPTSGDILIGDRLVNDIPIHKRNLGLVFQNYALFPHKTIGENIAFGLKYRNVTKADVEKKVKEALDIVRLPVLRNVTRLNCLVASNSVSLLPAQLSLSRMFCCSMNPCQRLMLICVRICGWN